MNVSTLVARNSTIMLAAQLVARASGLATFMVLTRFLNVGEIGLFGYAVSLVGFLVLGVDFGFDLVLTREAAREDSANKLGLTVRLKTQLFLVLYPILILVAWLMTGFSTTLLVVAVLGAGVWHESVNRTFSAFFLARGHAEYGLVSEFLTSVFRFSTVLCVLLAGARLRGVATAYFMASGATAIALVTWALCGRVRLRFSVGGQEARRVLVEAASFVAYALLFQAYFRIDVVLLGVMRPAAEVGQYVAAFRVIESLLVVPAALTGAIYPVLSRLDAEQDGRAFGRACAEMTRWLSVVGLGLATAVGLAASPVVRVIAGRGYEPAAGYLPVLLPAFALISLNCVGLIALNAVRRQRATVRIMLLGAVMKFAWDLALIPRFGAMAACIGCGVTELAVTIAIVAAARAWYHPRAWGQAWSGGAMASCSAIVVAVAGGALPPVGRLVAAAVVFVAVAIVTRAVRRDDLATLWGLWRSRTVGTVEAT